jgi:hypothetical protein
LLAEELDRTGVGWGVVMTGDGKGGHWVWDWRVELDGGKDDLDCYESNPETNQADVIPINRVR